MNNNELKVIADAMLEKKAQDVVSLDLKSIGTAISDYFIVCNADSTANVVAIAFHKKASCVILTDNLTLNDEAYLKAKEHNINVFSSSKRAYEVAIDLYKIYGGKNE